MHCTGCGKPAVTRDGRSLCLKCLRAAIRKETPVPGEFRRFRGSDQRENTYETKHGRD